MYCDIVKFKVAPYDEKNWLSVLKPEMQKLSPSVILAAHIFGTFIFAISPHDRKN